MSLGVERSVLFWGKALALSAMIVALLAPAAALVVMVLWTMGGGDVDTLVRLLMMGLAYLVYFVTFGALTLFASAKLPSSRSALVAMVGVWGLFALVVPRLATEVSVSIESLPSRAELAREISVALEEGALTVRWNGIPQLRPSLKTSWQNKISLILACWSWGLMFKAWNCVLRRNGKT